MPAAETTMQMCLYQYFNMLMEISFCFQESLEEQLAEWSETTCIGKVLLEQVLVQSQYGHFMSYT